MGGGYDGRRRMARCRWAGLTSMETELLYLRDAHLRRRSHR
jgi:hypothetical protein